MKQTIFFYILLVTFCLHSWGNVSFAQDNVSKDTFPQRCYYLEDRIFELVNQYRADNGLKPVLWSEQVYQAASNHARYLSQIEGISHRQTKDIDKYSEKKGFIERISYFVPNPSMTGEIIINGSLIGFNDSVHIKSVPVALVDGWKQSEGHNEVMLTAGYEQGAVAVFKDKDNGIKPVFIFVKR